MQSQRQGKSSRVGHGYRQGTVYFLPSIREGSGGDEEKTLSPSDTGDPKVKTTGTREEDSLGSQSGEPRESFLLE